MNPGSITLIGLPVLVTALVTAPITAFRWRLGFYAFLLFLPFAGTVSLSFYPSPLPKLLKDVLFVIPLYAILTLFHLSDIRSVRVPIPVAVSLLALAILVLVQAANPAIPNIAVAVLGVKVWLLYIPLLLVIAGVVRTASDYHGLLRFLVLLAVIPCTFGLFQYWQSLTFGYRATMSTYYGPATFEVTQRFSNFDFGGIRLFRIPSTFTFVTQYFGFIFASIVPAYVVWRTDPNVRWRVVGGLVLVLLIIAGFLSGARAAFLFIPGLLGLFLLFEGRATILLVTTPIFVCAIAVVAVALGFDLSQLIDDTIARLLHREGTLRPVVLDFLSALSAFPFGNGTGMNTGAARIVAPGELILFETYYGRVVQELGILGLVVTVSVFGTIIGFGISSARDLNTFSYKLFSLIAIGFVIATLINNLKGRSLDLDPINVYLWIYVGLLFRLPALEQESTYLANRSSGDPLLGPLDRRLPANVPRRRQA